MLIKTQYENTDVKAVTPAGEAHNGVPVNGEIKGVNLPTGMAEVVTAVAWEECEAIVMVTIVLLVIWVCGTEPKH